MKGFVSHSIAERLKNLGFKDRVLTFYEDKNVRIYHDATFGWDFNTSFLNCMSRPTISQALEWARETHGIYSVPRPVLGSKNGYDSFPILGWEYDILQTNKDTENSFYMGYPVGAWMSATIDVFEDGDSLDDLGINLMKFENAMIDCLENIIIILEKQNESSADKNRG